MNEQIYELILNQLRSAYEILVSEAPTAYKVGYYEATIEHVLEDVKRLKGGK